ncbi:flagellar basal body-associated protein FliL [Sulfitobacter aestuariivivens]|uniref:flagellar basal body-associated protein FliL n=1 Tax=Sulfitobacter aestuariivivens TaxID=2766981 RepID=UPI003616872B
MRMLLPLLLLLIGSAAGVAAGIYFRPAADTGPAASQTSDPTVTMPENGGKGVKDDSGAVEYVKLSNQFVVPIVKGGNVASLVVLALSMEVPAGLKETIYRHEPKLRDSFLQVLFDHANVGGSMAHSHKQRCFHSCALHCARWRNATLERIRSTMF